MENVMQGIKFAGRCLLKYGDPFPEVGDVLQVDIPNYGECEVTISKVSKPEWEDPETVVVNTEYYIEKIIEENKEYRLKKSGLKVVK